MRSIMGRNRNSSAAAPPRTILSKQHRVEIPQFCAQRLLCGEGCRLRPLRGCEGLVGKCLQDEGPRCHVLVSCRLRGTLWSTLEAQRGVPVCLPQCILRVYGLIIALVAWDEQRFPACPVLATVVGPSPQGPDFLHIKNKGSAVVHVRQ